MSTQGQTTKTLKKHPFHLVDPSPWPVVGSIAAFLITFGTVLFVRGITSAVMYSGFALLVITMLGWFKDIIREAKTEHSKEARVGFRYGMALFITSEVMFFVAFFWAYLNASLMPNEAMGNVWPPKTITPINPLDFPYLNTLLLLMSGTTITWAHHSMVENNLKECAKMIFFTVLLGVIFLGVQVYEYHHATFAFKGGIYPSTFYMATGFHGAHVFIGVCMLVVCWFRTRAGHFTAKDHFGFEASAWYWHFVDVVWLFLFVMIYLWGSGDLSSFFGKH